MDLNMLLAQGSMGGSSNNNPHAGLLASLLAQQSGTSLPPAPASDSASAVSAIGGTDSHAALLQALLQQQQQQQLQKQREDQERALLLQKLQELSNPQGAAPVSSATDELSLLLLQKQRQQVNAMSMFGTAAANPFWGSNNMQANLAAASPGSQFDPAILAQLLQQQPMAALAGAAGNHSSGLGLGGGILPPPPATATATSTTNHALAAADMALALDRRRKGRTGTFPQKLHQMLADLAGQEGGADIASFLPHGRAFAIHKPRDFVKHVMPKYFRMSRFSSFQRQLNLYDFQRITEGPDKGSYYHELFVQNRPILATMMKRNKIKGIKNKNNETDTTASAENSTSSAPPVKAQDEGDKDADAEQEEEV
jgi:hypothetical protein